jgi:5-bromo-4-chloroindolyl phosphate hydrolysis protein
MYKPGDFLIVGQHMHLFLDFCVYCFTFGIYCTTLHNMLHNIYTTQYTKTHILHTILHNILICVYLCICIYIYICICCLTNTNKQQHVQQWVILSRDVNIPKWGTLSRDVKMFRNNNRTKRKFLTCLRHQTNQSVIVLSHVGLLCICSRLFVCCCCCS